VAKDYHQLRRAVSFASFGKLRFKTEYEQDLWSECSRLIANCIIFYNASLLSRLLEHQEKSGDTQGAEAVKKISPIAWQHINLHGRYEFQKPLDPLDVDAIIREMTGFRPDHHMAQAALIWIEPFRGVGQKTPASCWKPRYGWRCSPRRRLQ